jgi:translation initiation factor IF-2
VTADWTPARPASSEPGSTTSPHLGARPRGPPARRRPSPWRPACASCPSAMSSPFAPCRHQAPPAPASHTQARSFIACLQVHHWPTRGRRAGRRAARRPAAVATTGAAPAGGPVDRSFPLEAGSKHMGVSGMGFRAAKPAADQTEDEWGQGDGAGAPAGCARRSQAPRPGPGPGPGPGEGAAPRRAAARRRGALSGRRRCGGSPRGPRKG